MLKPECRGKDCPTVYGPPKILDNRFNRWSWKGPWGRIFEELVAQAQIPEDPSIDCTAVMAHRSAVGGKGGRRLRPSRGGPTAKIHVLKYASGRIAAWSLIPVDVPDMAPAPARLAAIPAPKRLIAGKGYDANSLRRMLTQCRSDAVIPATRSRARPIPDDGVAYRARNRIERAARSLKDWRRRATRHDRRARNLPSAVAFAAVIPRWT